MANEGVREGVNGLFADYLTRAKKIYIQRVSNGRRHDAVLSSRKK